MILATDCRPTAVRSYSRIWSLETALTGLNTPSTLPTLPPERRRHV